MSGLSSLLKFYSGMADALKEVRASISFVPIHTVPPVVSFTYHACSYRVAPSIIYLPRMYGQVLANRDAAVAHLSRTAAAADSARAAQRKFIATNESQQAR